MRFYEVGINCTLLNKKPSFRFHKLFIVFLCSQNINIDLDYIAKFILKMNTSRTDRFLNFRADMLFASYLSRLPMIMGKTGLWQMLVLRQDLVQVLRPFHMV